LRHKKEHPRSAVAHRDRPSATAGTVYQFCIVTICDLQCDGTWEGKAMEALALPKRVQLERHTYEVTGRHKGGMGTVWLLRRPDGADYDTIYGRTRAVKTFDSDEDEQEAIIEQE